MTVLRSKRALSAGQIVADATSITSQKMDVSIKDMIVNVVPSNLLKAFLDSNMLQLIFLAVLCGIAAGLIGKYSEMIKSIFEAFNDLFLKITTLSMTPRKFHSKGRGGGYVPA